MSAANIFARVLVAWLLAMQPLLGAYAKAHAAHGPISSELCRGAPTPLDGRPTSAPDHVCCIATCVPFAVPASLADTAQPGVHTAAVYPSLDPLADFRAELSPRSARAPPLELSINLNSA